MEKEIENEVVVTPTEVVESTTESTEAPTPKKRTRKKAVVADVPTEEAVSTSASTNTFAEKVEEVKEEPLVNPNQLNVMKIALGWNDSNPLRYPTKGKGEPHPTLYSYRNRFFTDPKPQLDDLVQKGFMERAQFGTNGITHTGYKVTQKGIDYIAEVEHVVIKIKPNQKY